MIQHIRRPLSAYGFCGKPAVKQANDTRVCRECADIQAAYRPQPPIIPTRAMGPACFDHRADSRFKALQDHRSGK